MQLPEDLLVNVEAMAEQQLRPRSNMLRVLIHRGMQAVSEDEGVAAEIGLVNPAPGQSSAGQG